MNKASIKAQSRVATDARLRLISEEAKLAATVWEFLEPRGSMRSIARELKISAQYLCDISNGRRKVSATVLERVMGL